MSLDKYVAVLSACVGFLSALFFALGTLRMKDQDIKSIASTYWDFNQHLADSISAQKAEYVVGSLLLLLAFVLQLAATLLPADIELSFLQPLMSAILAIGFSFCAIATLTWFLALSIATRTKMAVRELLQSKTQVEKTSA